MLKRTFEGRFSEVLLFSSMSKTWNFERWVRTMDIRELSLNCPFWRKFTKFITKVNSRYFTNSPLKLFLEFLKKIPITPNVQVALLFSRTLSRRIGILGVVHLSWALIKIQDSKYRKLFTEITAYRCVFINLFQSILEIPIELICIRLGTKINGPISIASNKFLTKLVYSDNFEVSFEFKGHTVSDKVGAYQILIGKLIIFIQQKIRRVFFHLNKICWLLCFDCKKIDHFESFTDWNNKW